MHIFREPESWNVSTGTSRSPGPEHAWYKGLNGSRNSETWFPKGFKKFMLLIVQYKYLKSCSRRFYCPNPPHKIMWKDVYYSTQLSFWFPTDRICQAEMISIGGVPVSKRHFGGAGPSIFYMIHRGGRTKTDFLYWLAGSYTIIGSYMSAFMYAPGHHWPDMSKTQPLPQTI